MIQKLPHVDPVTLVDAENVVLTVESVKKIEEWLA